MLAVLPTSPPEREDRKQITIDQVGLSKAPRNIHPVVLFIVQFQPAFNIAQTCQRVVSEHVLVGIFAIESSELDNQAY